jgi:S-adenosylmethionine decarboxylase
MAYTDSLFQLGMDLTRSSTAQKEDHGQTARLAHDAGKGDAVESEGSACAGTHLIIDLYGAERLDDLAHIKKTLKRCMAVAGASPMHIHVQRAMPQGSISGVAVLAEGHISIHSWPQMRNAALDIFMGGEATPHAAIDAVNEAFRPKRAVVTEHLRAHAPRERPFAETASRETADPERASQEKAQQAV